MADIEISGPDGSSFSFPEGTSSDVIKGAMKKHYGGPKSTPEKKGPEGMALPDGGFMFFDPKQQEQFQKGQTEGIKGGVSGLAQMATGAAELVDPTGYAAKAGKYLKTVGDPTMQEVGKMTGAFIPLPIGKGEAVAEGLSFGKRLWEGAKGGAKVGGIYGAAAPTYEEELVPKYKKKILQALEGGALGSVIGGLGGAIFGRRPEVITSEQIIDRVRKTGESMSDAARKLAEDQFGTGTKEAQDAFEAAMKGVQERKVSELGVQAERMSQAEKKARAVVAPEDEAIRAASRKQTGFVDPVNVADDMEKLAASRWEAAQARKAQGGKAYETFADAAKEREAVQPFEATPQGQSLFEELSSIAEGGEEDLIKYTKAERAVASDIVKELFPRKAASVSEEEVAKRAAQNPNKSMSPAAKMMQARKELQQAAVETAESRRPVNFEVVKKKAQELRALQEQRGGPAGFKVQVGERYQDPAQRIESALKEWVGEENWPASIYKEASKEANKFETELGEALRSQEKIPFRDEPGKFTTPRKDLPRLVFRSKDDTKFAKELLGEGEVNRLGEAYASNEIKGLDSAGVVKWMEKNDFYKSVPGLEDKLKRYTDALKVQEGNVVATKALRSQRDREADLLKSGFNDVVRDIDAEAKTAKNSLDKKVSAAGKALESTTKAISEFEKTIAGEPQAALNNWPRLRARLEETGVFPAAQLDELGAALQQASLQAQTEVAADAMKTALKAWMIKTGWKWTLGALPVAGLSGYELYKIIGR